jgi:hypothetical protein
MKWQMLVVLMLLASSCTSQPQATSDPDTPVTSQPGENMSANEPALSPFAPKPDDKDLTRGNVYLNEASLVIRESSPPRVSLMIKGDLPTPCNQLRAAIGAPNAENKIEVDLYSVSNPNKACAQVLKPFEESIDLGNLPTGHYTVWVNGEVAGEFDT